MKKTVIIVVAAIFLVVVAILLFTSSPKDQDPSLTDNKKTDQSQINHSAPADDESDNTDQDSEEIVEEEEVPEVTADIVKEAIFEPGDVAETKFLTGEQKKELNSASIVKREKEVRKAQRYHIEWADTAFAANIPDLPEKATVYLLDRPEESSIFDYLRELSDQLRIKGAIIRMSPQKYAVADIASGEYFLTYDLYHLLFNADSLNIPSEDGEDGVTASLEKWGLLGFPFTKKEAVDNNDNTWYRYSPDLPLPVLTLNRKPVSNTFEPGELGSVDVETDGDYIMAIRSQFPNIKEFDILPLLNTEEVSKSLSEGSFKLGSMELQYPGAVSLDDKKSFYQISKREKISISDAKLSDMECGYLLEDDKNIQALMSPVCIAHGRGKVKQQSVFFQVVVPAVK